MLTDYLAIGSVELVNSARLRAYLQSIGSPLSSGPEVCACDALTADILDPDGVPYTTPGDPDNPAEWYDPDVPESAEFLGLLLLEIEGVDDYPVQRSVTNSVVGGGSLGPARVLPRQMVFRALLLGATCCGVNYGLTFLKQALQGCTGSQCGGDCVTLLDCCPSEGDTRDEFLAKHRRTFRRVALTDGPRVTGRDGTGSCGGSCAGSDILTVEWTLTAATPFAYTDETELLDVAIPTDDDAECVTWCRHDSTGDCLDGECRLAECPNSQDSCADPECVSPAPPVPTSPDTCFCQSLAVNSAAYDIDLSSRPGWIDDVPLATVYAGSSDLRRLTVTLYQRTEADTGLTCAELAEKKRCEPYAQWNIGFVPAGGELFLDGQTGRATLDCNRQCSPATTVYGYDGAPPTWPVLNCAGFCLLLETDAFTPPADDATLSFSVSGRVL